jgi:hypothetical protein
MSSLALLRQQLAAVVAPERLPAPGLPTGIPALDPLLLAGGLPRGKLTELVGVAGSGRTTVLRRLVAATIAQGATVAIVDASATLDARDWVPAALARVIPPALVRAGGAAAWGMPREAQRLVVVRPPEPARGAWCADVLLRSGAFALVVLDGAPAMTRAIAVRLMGLARERDAAFVVSGPPGQATQLGGAVRLRVERVRADVLAARRGASRTPWPHRAPLARARLARTGPAPPALALARVEAPALPGTHARPVVIRVEKGGRLEAVEVDRAIRVARRVCAHPEVPDRRAVATGHARGARGGRLAAAARARRCAEPQLTDGTFAPQPQSP